MARNVSINVTDATASTIAIVADTGREELFIRNGGTARVYLGFNEVAIDGAGIFLESGDALILSTDGGGKKLARATGNVYMVCSSGLTATVMADITGV